MDAFFQQYGPVAMLAYLIIRDGLPFLMKSVLPKKMAADEEDRKRRRDFEERGVKAQEQLVEAMRQMSLAITVNNERMNTVLSNQGTMMEHNRQIGLGLNDVKGSLLMLQGITPHRRAEDQKGKPDDTGK